MRKSMYRELVNCPKCGSSVYVPVLNVPLRDPVSAEIVSTILKRCPHCLLWSWMSLQTQSTT
jgi:hypothetical protein